MATLGLLVLDYDGTIVENHVDFYEAYCEALMQCSGVTPGFEEFLELLKENNLHERIPRNMDPEYFWRLFRRAYRSRHSNIRRGLREFLVLMKNLNVKITVISGRETPPTYIEWDLRRHGLQDYVDGVYTSYVLGVIGERENFLFDKSPLIEFAKRMHGVNGEIVCIGDYITDFHSCRKVGGIFIGISNIPGRSKELERAGVLYFARDFYEVLVHLHTLNLLN